jgi:cbb3-type cytochrome oxidase subunit 3
MQTTEQILDQLNDIQLPDPIGWWPLAFSWWIMIFVMTSIIVGVLWYYFDQKRRNRYRVSAKSKLQKILDNKYSLDSQKISEINALLKQVALTAYGRKQTSSLKSEEWVKFLKQTCGYIKQPEGLLEIIEIGYKSQRDLTKTDTQDELKKLHTYALKWIKGHHQ